MALMRRPDVREAFGDAFVMFWLVVLMCINLSEDVQCLTCKDNISPTHDTDACPLTTIEDVRHSLCVAKKRPLDCRGR